MLDIARQVESCYLEGLLDNVTSHLPAAIHQHHLLKHMLHLCYQVPGGGEGRGGEGRGGDNFG